MNKYLWYLPITSYLCNSHRTGIWPQGPRSMVSSGLIVMDGTTRTIGLVFPVRSSIRQKGEFCWGRLKPKHKILEDCIIYCSLRNFSHPRGSSFGLVPVMLSLKTVVGFLGQQEILASCVQQGNSVVWLLQTWLELLFWSTNTWGF